MENRVQGEAAGVLGVLNSVLVAPLDFLGVSNELKQMRVFATCLALCRL